MTQLLRKWIQDDAVNSDKLDSFDSYTMVSLHVTTDATVGGISNLGDTTVSGELYLGSDSTVNIYAPKIKVHSFSNYSNNAAAVAGLGGNDLLYRNGDNLCITHA
jgi:hypothetical protein